MSRQLLTLLLLFLCFFSCSKESNNSNLNSSLQSVVVDISKETDADIMILNKDGSYAIYDSETVYGNGIVQFNTSFDNYFEDGITIIIGEDNLPLYAKVGDCYIYFSNFFWNTFDCAVVDENGEMFCYWNVPMDCFSDGILSKETKALTKSGMSEETKIGLWAATKITLFAIAATGAVLAVAPVVAGTATAVGILSASVAVTSLIATGYNEYCKSKDPANYRTQYADTEDVDQIGEALDWIDLKDGKFQFKMRSMKDWGLALLTPVLERFEVDLYQSIGQTEEMAEDYFLYRDYQIQLGTTLVECGPKSLSYNIDVETKTLWVIDDSGVDGEWCSVTKHGDGQIVVNVQEYPDGSEDRSCSAIIRSSDGRDDLVAPVKLTIKQSGVLFEVSASTFEFTQFAGNYAANVSYNNRVTKWEVTSYPDWCKAEKYGEEAVVVIVKDDKKLEVTKVGIVTLTAYIKDGYTVDRHITVKRVPILSWNGTSWHFEPHYTVSVNGDMEYSGGLDSFEISIQDEDAGVFTTNSAWESMRLNSDGSLSFSYKFHKTFTETYEGITYSVTIDESASLHMIRVDDSHAYATISAHCSASGDSSGTADVSGNATGNLIESTKRADSATNNSGLDNRHGMICLLTKL